MSKHQKGEHEKRPGAADAGREQPRSGQQQQHEQSRQQHGSQPQSQQHRQPGSPQHTEQQRQEDAARRQYGSHDAMEGEARKEDRERDRR